MSFDFKLAVRGSVRRLFSASFWLQAGACAIVGWSLLHGGVRSAPSGQPAALAAGTLVDRAALKTDADPSDGSLSAGGTAGNEPAGSDLAGLPPAAAPSGPQLAGPPSLDEANLALAKIDVTVKIG